MVYLWYMKIVIAGYGTEGKSNYNYFSKKYPDAELIIADESPNIKAPDGVSTLTGEGVFSRLSDADLVVRSAGLALPKIKTNGEVTSATNEFFKRCQNVIIGVTGTKGKGTTASLITEILRASGKTVHLIGNIGVPALEVLDKLQPEDIIVYELSSFQLWDIKYSPHIAVVLMIEPDHLDVHSSMEDYIAAKSRITKFQSGSDKLVYNQSNQLSSSIAKSSKAQLLPYPNPVDEYKDVLKIPGQHNQENLSAAILAVKDWVTDPEVIKTGISNFTGLPHRLKFVAEVEGVEYYNDSISTTPGSALAALSSFSERKVIILGGSDKGADYRELIEKCKLTDTSVIAIGQTAEKISLLCDELGVTCRRYAIGGMSDFVRGAKEMSKPGDVVLLSPASASFGLFANYADRGEQFISAVRDLIC